MTRNRNSNKIKPKSLWLTILICVLCLSMSMFFVACKNSNDNTSSTDKTYTKIEDDTADIKNGSFEYGTADVANKDFPQASPTNWTLTVDNSATVTSVSSGIVKTSQDAWDLYISKLYDNASFLHYAQQKYNIDMAQIREDNDNDSAKVKDYIIKEYLADGKGNFDNPKTPVGSEGNKILAINNYRSSSFYGFGTAQKATSAITLTLEKNSFAVIQVKVKTVGLSGDNMSGANIRLINKFNSVNQGEFGIYGIDTQKSSVEKDSNGWATYKIYVKSDASYDCTIQVVLGLGFGNGSSNAKDYTQGTAYFDEVTYTKLTELPTGVDMSAATKLTYESDSAQNEYYVNAYNSNQFAYDMSLNTGSNYFNQLVLNNVDVNAHFTSSDDGNGGKITSQTLFGAQSNIGDLAIDGNAFSLKNIKNASVSIKIQSSKFSIPTESYVYVSFKIKNNLSEFDRNGISVYAYDVNGKGDIPTSILSTTTVGEDTECTVMVKNEFTEGANKDFYLMIIVGPKSVKSTPAMKQYATGDVEFFNFRLATGLTYQYIKNSNPQIETANYDFYSLFSAKANATVTLYNGQEKPNADTEDNTYNLSVSPSDVGKIQNKPANVKDFLGVATDHVYVGGDKFNANTRSGDGDTSGNVAGLINTKYLDTYTIANLKTNLNYNGTKPSQPIVIYNNVSDSYGFLGNPITVASSAYAKISVKVRVTGDAKAYVYLIDVSQAVKDVLSLTYTENTDEYGLTVNNGQSKTQKLSFEGITSDMMDENGWLTLNFYVAAGATAKEFRLELWNGSRDGLNKSQGFVFYSIDGFNEGEAFTSVTATNGFTEVSKWENTFTATDSVLKDKNSDVLSSALYLRQLDDTEKKYNKENANDASKLISYTPNYIWVKTADTCYAVYNTVDPVAVNPYNKVEDEESSGSGCAAQSDPSTFWLSFSSILLAVVLVLAIVMLIVKNVRRKRKANKNDAKSHFNVNSRYSNKNKAKTKKNSEKTESKTEEDDYIQPEEDNQPEIDQAEVDEPEQETNQTEQTLDEYIYGDVQDFGDNETNE